MTDIFINITNHPSANWSEKQREAALATGAEKIVDIQFPDIPASAGEIQILSIAKDYLEQIEIVAEGVYNADILLQGEFSFVMALYELIQKKNKFYRELEKIPGYPKPQVFRMCCATSERKVIEKNENGQTTKTAVFDFVRFRYYN